MKILITTEFFLPFHNGIVTAVLTQKKALQKSGHEVRILTIGDTTKSYYDERGGVYYIRRSSLLPQADRKETNSPSLLFLNDSLLKEIYVWSPDIIHAQNEWFTTWLGIKIAKKINIPLVHTLHTDFDSYNSLKNQKLWVWVMKKIYPILMKPISVDICLTDKGQYLIRKYGGGKHKIVQIPVGMDLDFFRQKLDLPEKRRLQDRYGIMENDIVLITICRLVKEKRVIETIHHFSNLCKLCDNIKLLIVGDGVEKEKLKEFVISENLTNNVIFAGFIPFNEIWKYYSLGDIFITSSLSENQGLMYNESLAAGLPLLARKDEPLEECLIEGVNGYSFTNDKEFLQKAMILINDKDKRLEMGRNAANSVEKYSLDIFAAKLVNLYEEEIAKKKQSSR